jgi:hypothetical protein
METFNLGGLLRKAKVASLCRSGINGNEQIKQILTDEGKLLESLLFVEVELMETCSFYCEVIRVRNIVASLCRSGINGNNKF